MTVQVEWRPIRVWRRFFDKRRLRRLREGFPSLLSHMSSALRAGISLAGALSAAEELSKGPLQEELKLLLQDIAAGLSWEDALERFERRVPLEEAGLLAQSVETLRRCGGNLVQTFDLLRETIVERVRLQRKIAMLTAQGEMQAIVLLLLPWLLLLLLAVLSPAYTKPLVQERLGWCFLFGIVALETVGAVWLKSIVRVRV